MKFLFWLSLGLLGYTYAGYFVVLTLIGPIFRKLRRASRAQEGFAPKISMILSVHNEEKLIAQRIENFQALDYPTEQLDMMIGDDCSTDRTREIIRSFSAKDPRIKLHPFDSHQGKTEVINQLVPQARGDVIAFTDANTFYATDAMKLMARHFADDNVGSVCGRLILKSRTGANTDDSYWMYETLIKRREDDLGVVLGANGGIYTMRKSLFQPLQSNVIQIDDFIWPVKVYEDGHRGVYEPAAIAHEEAAPYVEAEFRRKIRIGTGDYRAIRECWKLLLPWRGWIAFAFWSHKVIRWLAPFLLLLAFITNLYLLDESLYRLLFALQLAFYACAGIGWMLSRQDNLIAKLFRLPYYFTGSNIALLIGFFKCITGRQKATWTQPRT